MQKQPGHYLKPRAIGIVARQQAYRSAIAQLPHVIGLGLSAIRARSQQRCGVKQKVLIRSRHQQQTGTPYPTLF